MFAQNGRSLRAEMHVEGWGSSSANDYNTAGGLGRNAE